MSSGNPAVIQRWLAGGLRTVMLPTGIIFAFRVPDVEDMVQKGLVPDDLRKEALKFAASAVVPESMDTESLSRMLRFMRALVAQSLRYVWEGEPEPIEAWEQFDPTKPEWKAVTLTLADMAEVQIDPDDYAALQGIVSRTFTPKQVTAMALLDHGLIDRDLHDQIIAGQASGTVGGWASFRDERRGTDAGASVEPMASAPVGDRGRQRSAGGARAGRSTRRPTGTDRTR